MNDGAGAGLVDQRDILLDPVIGLHLEAIPVAPQGRADAIVAEQVRDLVAFDGMVKCRHLVAEFLAHIDDIGHLVGAVAVVMDHDLALQHIGQSFHAQVTGLILAGGALLLILARLDPGLAVDRHIAHAGAGFAALAAIDPLGIFAARHFQALRRTWKLHSLHSARGHILERHAAAAKQVGRTGQNLKRRHAAIGERAGKAGVLRPDAMFGPDMRGDGRRRLIAVGQCLDAGRGIIAQMAVNIDDARGHIFALRVDHHHVRGDRRVRSADGRNLTVGQEDHAIIDASALPVKDGRTAQHRRPTAIRTIGRRIRIFGLRRRPLRGGPFILVLARGQRGCAAGQQDSRDRQ